MDNTTQCNAIFLEKPKKAFIGSCEIPKELKQHEVLIKMLSASICETDLKIYDGSIKTKKLPIIMGHEGVGKVIAIGDNVVSVKEGDIVLIDPNIYDGTCNLCRKGLTNLCPSGGLLGRDIDGLFREYIILRETNLYRLPSSIDLNIAPLIQPLSTVVHAQKYINVNINDVVVIFGTGVTGLMHLQLVKARGGFTICIDKLQSRLEIAKKVGADVTLLSDENIERKILELTNEEGAEIVIDAVGHPDIAKQAIKILKPEGTLLQFGISTKEMQLPMYDLYFKEIKIQGVRSSTPIDFIDAIKVVLSGKVDLTPLVSMVLEFNEATEKFDYIIENKASIIRPIIRFT
uniref:Enoyl reductase (ER) domain-containing protein n=1 Tax=Ignisphaera aggregans TaxID=334771 RepID=A0A7J3QEX3_9CREN